jgi:hypothetical protein
MKTSFNVLGRRLTQKAGCVGAWSARRPFSSRLSRQQRKKRITRRGDDGYALMLTMFMVAITLTLLIATVSRLTGDADLNARNGQYNASLYAAEAATERVIGRMRYDFLVGGGSETVTNNLDTYRAYYPGKLGLTEDPSGYWTNFQFSDGQGHGNATYVGSISNAIWGPLDSQFVGLKGWTQVYRVLSNAKQANGRFNLTNAVQQDLQLISVPVFQFAIFYNGLLEFTWCATFTVNGRTHANGNIFVGSSQNLTFSSTVTTTGGIYKTNWDGHTTGQMTGTTTYSGNPGYTTNNSTLTLPIGTNSMAPAAVREIVNMPPIGEDPTSGLGEARYFNKAKVVLLVTDTNVSAYFKTSVTDAPTSITVTNYGFNTNTNLALLTNFPFLSVTNNFIDQRELSKYVRPTQIDVGIYKDWLITNPVVAAKFPPGTTPYPDVLYVMDQRTIGANTNLYSVRLRNGAIIPTNGPANLPGGWTVATPNPLYVWGHYNIGPGGSLTAGNTDTSKTFPASLVSDALTILSGSWSDASGGSSVTSRNASSTTINAAVLTGIVFSTDATSNHFSGGVMNLPRLLEDWSSDTLTMNTSIVNLFNSVRATNWFQNPGVYYLAPTRSFSFDNNFTNQMKLPPETPVIGLINRSKWRVPPPNTVNYAGN